MIKEMTIDEINRIPMFFIVGRPRTGSTLLRTLFDAHPNTVIPQEWPMVMLLYKKFGARRNWDTELLTDFYHTLFTPLRIKHWTLDNWPDLNKQQLHSALMQCTGEWPLATLIKIVYLHYNSFYTKQEILQIGDKNPATSLFTPLLVGLFPEAKFIHLTRDYRDNVVSLLDVDFEMPNIPLLVYRWKYFFKLIEKCSQQVPHRFIRLRYEDLVHDPENEFAKLCSFLGINNTKEIVDFHTRKSAISNAFTPELVDTYFKSLLEPINNKKVGVFHKRLTNKQIRIADLVAGRTAERAGYKREFSSFSLLEYIKAYPMVLYARWLYLIGKMVGFLPFGLMVKLMNKPSVVVKYYTKLIKKKPSGTLEDK
jgi:hypothetical protein